jgi:hypothetical protein
MTTLVIALAAAGLLVGGASIAALIGRHRMKKEWDDYLNQ